MTTAETEDTTTHSIEIITESSSAADYTTTTMTTTEPPTVSATIIVPTPSTIVNSTTQKSNSTENPHRLTCYWHHSAVGVPEEVFNIKSTQCFSYRIVCGNVLALWSMGDGTNTISAHVHGGSILWDTSQLIRTHIQGMFENGAVQETN